MNLHTRAIVALALAATITTMAQAQPPAKTSAPAKAQAPAANTRASARTVAPPTVATIGDERIQADELERGVSEALDLYRQRNGQAIDPQLEPVVRRQVLENLIRQRLLALEAKRRHITVSDEDAEAELKRDPVFQEGGSFSEARYLTLKSTHPDAYARSMAAIKTNLASRRASQEMERQTHVDDAAVRTQVERQMVRASVDYLALRGNEMDGTYAEPRESEILAWYRAHADQFRLPEQAVLSVIPVNKPAIADSVAATDAGFRAWDQAMRTRADSARAAIRAGAKFEDLAGLYGGARGGLFVSRDRTPEAWRGTAGEVAAALAAAPGTVLPEPVRMASGWGIVRVETVLPARTAPLRQVSKAIRDTLRAQARRRVEDRGLLEAYRALRDSLKTDAWRIRYAWADTGTFAPAEPTPQEIERFYRDHLADYSTFDRASSQVVEVPLARVRDEIRLRWRSEHRMEAAHAAAQRLLDAWSHGRRDPALEKSMTWVRGPELIPSSSPTIEGALGEAILADLQQHPGQLGTTLVTTNGGFAVVQLIETVHGYVPTFEQARDRLGSRGEEYTAREIEAGARALYDRDSLAFSAPTIIHFNRIVFEPPPIMEVPLTRAEVERWYRAHIDQYTVQELVHVRHILISPAGPGPAADAAARQKAEDILRRVRAGEDFAALAAKYTDDPATKNEGGDVGMFRHGQMLEPFERAAFAMRPGDITGPVRSEVGYHVLQCLEYLPPVMHPLREVYANVAHDCASAKATRMASERADSALKTLTTVAQARALAERLHLNIIPTDHAVGTLNEYGDDMRPYIRTLETLKAGQIHPAVQEYSGLGPVITWVDKITPSQPRPWPVARPYAYQHYRIDRARAVLEAKRAELDSMAKAGWSFDSLGTLWGGLEHMASATVGTELRGMGGRTLSDSLIFGIDHPPVLAVGQVSPWIEFRSGLVKMRVNERLAPDPDEVTRRVALRHQVVLWHRLNDYFDTLKVRYPVRILDGELRATALPEPTENS
jgi:parvulin-like peptidyl-prolyl isomerase